MTAAAAVELVHWAGPEAISTSSCQRLWLAILAEGINTALGKGLLMSRTAQDEALLWLGTPDFEAVCLLAGVDPVEAYVRVETLFAEVDA